MYLINKITSDHVVDFAAEELKKYLRMMMPDCGEIDIRYDPSASDGFRLGVMADFGLDTSEAEDIVLDDIIHIDTDKTGGIIAGSNTRSVLLSVYRYLTINGCRWLFPGIDGEFIPVKDVEAVKYHKLADCRYRGQCNEGAESQPIMMDAIDFTPKIGMNIFMIEFDNPRCYYDVFYGHKGNPAREPEPVSPETVMQWKRLCEAEISKRGLQFHDMGHGWTAEPFGLDSSDGWIAVDDWGKIPDESRDFVAMIDGKRELYKGVALNTNFCMSNDTAREKVAKYIADYSEKHTNVDYLHIWLADGYNNHCECENCQKMTPSDWYMMLMNEIDEELTKRQLDTRIVFICYVDTTWAPEKIFIKNPKRFSLLLAAISRRYTEPVSMNVDPENIKISEYKRNKNTLPKSVDEYIVHGKMWQERCKVDSFVYEYHYWNPYNRDIGVMDLARIIYDDIHGYSSNGLKGIVEDGSQRSFFPNGLCFYTYGSALYDLGKDYDDIKKEYFATAYGDDWKKVEEFFLALGKAVDFRYLNGALSSDYSVGAFYNPSLVPSFREALKLVKEFVPFVREHMNMPYRVQTVSYRMLLRYTEYCEMLINTMILKASGLNEESKASFNNFLLNFGKYELELERYFDQYMMSHSLGMILGR